MRNRRGSMLLEVSIAVVLLAVALGAVAQLLAVGARQRHTTRWRSVATSEVANVMEHVMALPWQATTPERLDAIAPHPETQAMLPDVTLAIATTDVTEPRPAKRIHVSLVYRNTAGQFVEPIVLVAWKFSPGGDP